MRHSLPRSLTRVSLAGPPLNRCLLCVVLMTVLLAACGRSDQAASAGKPPVKPAAAAASAPLLLLAPEDLRTLQPSMLVSGPVVSGSVQPERRADLQAEVATVVMQVLKDNGEVVRTGDLLVRLDDTSIRDSLTSADETVRALTQAFEQSERQVQRLKTLQGQGMISMQGLEDAEVRRNSAQSDLVAAKARVVSARQMLRRTEVRAPFDGVVSERKVSVGDTVQVGKELLKVIDPRSMRFEGLVSADRSNELRIGQTVSFRVNGFNGKGDFTARVRRIDAAANATTRQVALVADFVDPASAPRVAGLFAEGRVETGGTQALMLPEGSLVRNGDLAVAWRVNDTTLQRVPLKLGERDARSGNVAVLQGLAPGDRVLRNPGSALVDGQRVQLTGASSIAPGTGASAGSSATSATAAR